MSNHEDEEQPPIQPPAFVDLLVNEEVVGSLPIPEDGQPTQVKLAKASRYWGARYECIRCRRAKSGGSFAAVVVDSKFGVCWKCSFHYEESVALSLPSWAEVKPKKAAIGRGNAKAMVDQIMSVAKAKELETVPPSTEKEPCPGCHRPSFKFDRQQSLLSPELQVCSGCAEAEQLRIRTEGANAFAAKPKIIKPAGKEALHKLPPQPPCPTCNAEALGGILTYGLNYELRGCALCRDKWLSEMRANKPFGGV